MGVKAVYLGPGKADRKHGKWSKAERSNAPRSSIHDQSRPPKLIMEGETGNFSQALLDKYPDDFEKVKPGPKPKVEPSAPSAEE